MTSMGGTVFKLADSTDAVRDVKKAIGDMDQFDVAGGRVLVWIYIRPRKVGSILMPDSAVREDLWQGAVGYVLKTGPLAFVEDAQNHFAGFSAKPGDWVLFTPGEGKRVQINGIDCRLVEDALIQMKIANPDLVTHRQ